MNFEGNLEFGQAGESAIARWLRRRGTSVLPAYEKEISTGKGPRLFTPSGELVVPDLVAFLKRLDVVFVEAKHKSVFSWHHLTKEWCTGIDLHHYDDYQKVQRETKKAVYLLFLHEQSTPHAIDLRGREDCASCRLSDTGTCAPADCPTGLFGRALGFLTQHEHHRHGGWGRHGMVYWAHGALKLLAPLEELQAASEGQGAAARG